MNQQRRPFFQAVKNTSPGQRILSPALESGFRLCGRIAATFAVLLFLSCSSLTPERVQLLAQIAGQAAQIGAQEWLSKHPEHRQAFDAVLMAIQALVRGGVTNQSAYADLLNSLPTPTLAGPSGELYVTEDRLVIWDAHLKKAVAVEGKAEQPVIRATVAGLKRGLAPLPPMPVVSRVGRTLPKVEPRRVTVPVNSSASTNHYYPNPWWHTNEVRQPPRNHILLPVPEPRIHTNELFTPTVAVTNLPVVKPTGRTNVTRSVVDVVPNPGRASTVKVRWVLGPNSIYHIEHRNEGGTEWFKFDTVTNATATGPTNWQTTWNPVVPLGSWRVVRVR